MTASYISVEYEPSCVVQASNYIPKPAHCFTADEVLHNAHRINHWTVADAIVEHPCGAIVEYPQTGLNMGQAIVHVFPISVDHDTCEFDHPKACFQYSLGDKYGGQKKVHCHFL
jgi:hypothetical protein